MRSLWVPLVCFIGLFTQSSSFCGQPKVQPLSAKSRVTELPIRHARVIGGGVVQQRSLPWMALFFKWTADGEEQRCGATIISQNWLMTAAHCTHGFYYGKVILGATDLGIIYQRETYTIAESIVHPQYKPGVSLDNDIALLRVATRIHFNDHVQPICVTHNDLNMTKAGQIGNVAGWGVHSKPEDNDLFSFLKNISGPVERNVELYEEENLPDEQTDYEEEHKRHVVLWRLSKYLLEAAIPIIDTATCRERWFHEVKSDGLTQICAGSFQKGTGQGDSGGPLQVRGENGHWYQIGITSFGDNSSNETVLDQDANPGVFTRVAHYCQFIACTTAGEATCANTMAGETTCASSRSFVSLFATILAMLLLCLVVPSFSVHDYCI